MYTRYSFMLHWDTFGVTVGQGLNVGGDYVEVWCVPCTTRAVRTLNSDESYRNQSAHTLFLKRVCITSSFVIVMRNEHNKLSYLFLLLLFTKFALHLLPSWNLIGAYFREVSFTVIQPSGRRTTPP
jgi:hypothetical protein